MLNFRADDRLEALVMQLSESSRCFLPLTSKFLPVPIPSLNVRDQMSQQCKTTGWAIECMMLSLILEPCSATQETKQTVWSRTRN